ncbi:MAG: hypothetical protein M3R27_03570 [Bacteroidota bacterium]|nr:hypothetical protein [Bacteroidota bacterium]
MTVKTYFRLLIFFLYGCSDNSDRSESKSGHTQFGLYIENGPRQGFQYFDSAKTEYNYRYNTFTITNDTTVSIQLEIGFSEIDVKDIGYSKVFLLQRQLTPSEGLKRFLDLDTDKPEHLNKTLKPTEKCVFTFGVFTDTKYSDPTTPYETKLLTSKEISPTISCRLKINDTLVIPCGHFKYIEE